MRDWLREDGFELVDEPAPSHEVSDFVYREEHLAELARRGRRRRRPPRRLPPRP